ncbi:MAG: hypothetical protein Q9187_001115 [Circinaria calcarea]
MGVTGLWTVVQPCARPIKIETLNKKRLAVDASIWIYQFLKAVRDKEGNALRNSHVVGFFRRICKLLFIGIKPVFVFDGGAPALKRQTISGRKARREGRREDAVRTAGKLLAVQMQRRAEEEDRKRREGREERDRPTVDPEEEEIPDELVYVEELQMTAKERQQNRQFKKKDAYHLPELDVSLSEMGAPNDPRIMSQEDLEDYARQFHTGEDISVYDFSKIDFDSPFFMSLPASDRYNILNAARLRSRLRMGHSKDQLDTMFPDRMAFSRFQIDRVKDRNELTTRLMNINGMNGKDAMFGINGPGRVAGEKGKEYVLVKNDGVEGGWALGVVSNKHDGERNKPIDVESFGRSVNVDVDDEDGWEDDGFEDVPIEGLNRLPKRVPNTLPQEYDDEYESNELFGRRHALYEARQKAAGSKTGKGKEVIDEDPDTLFIPEDLPLSDKDANSEMYDALFEDIQATASEDDELSRAIAMSLENPEDNFEIWPQAEPEALPEATIDGPRIDRPLEFNQKNAAAGRAYAHLINARANGATPQSLSDDGDIEGTDLDLQAALTESRQSKYKTHGGSQVHGLREPERPKLVSPPAATISNSPKVATDVQAAKKFDGPLPFESINLGKSIFSSKKKKPLDEEAGGFEKKATEPRKVATPLPPWFTEDIRKELAAKKAFEDQHLDKGNPPNGASPVDNQSVLKRQKFGEVIDLDAPESVSQEIIDLESSNGGEDDVIMGETIPIDSEIRMGDVADLIRVEPPESEIPENTVGSSPKLGKGANASELERSDGSPIEEAIEWEESDLEANKVDYDRRDDLIHPAGGEVEPQSQKSPSPVFENVGLLHSLSEYQASNTAPAVNNEKASLALANREYEQERAEPVPVDDEDMYSDPDDDELLRQLAVEAEEHARFASTLNSKSQLQNAEDYERELRQLRNQQKKDRRDADEVSHIMVTECQQLLKLFGLPYITAPMEAEAQCAELVSLGLVDGIVTDDSDIFLFGGTRVYKNMFNQAKFVECYLSSDLEKEYSLDRNKVIQIAHLLGSDYTEGIPSIGPVTALEILSEFDSLENFKEWWSKVQMGQKLPEDASSPFRRKFRRNAAKLFLPPTFPDKRVDHAYLHPEVDSDPSPFAWGVPDLDALRQFLMATIGWSQERADEILVPVIRDMNRRETEGTQANITQFFGGAVGVGGREKASGNGAFAPRRRGEGKSQRMESALGRLHARAKERTIGESEAEVVCETVAEEVNSVDEGQATTKRPRVRRSAASKDVVASESGSGDEYEAPKRPRKRKKGAGKARKAGTDGS